MGVGLNWIARQGVDETGLLERLGLEPSGSATDEINSEYACTVLPNGWFVLVSGRALLKLDEILPVVSEDGFALGGESDDRSMGSELLGYRNGARTWAVTHDPDVDRFGLTVVGDPPPEFAEINASLTALQAEDAAGRVDYMFDVPVRLGEALCGYAYDAPGPLRVWTVLEPRRTRGRPRPAPRVAIGLEREVLPGLEAVGWTRMAEPIMGGLELERVLDGHRQYIQIEWQDHRRWLDVYPRFAILQDEAPGAPIKIEGRIIEPQPSLWRRLGGWLRRGGARQSYESRVAEVLERTRSDLMAIDRFVSGGPRDPRIAVRTFEPAEAPR